MIESHAFGAGPDRVGAVLADRGIETKRYYDPPVHRMRAYRGVAGGIGGLAETDRAAGQALTLPLWAGMEREHISAVTSGIEAIHVDAMRRKPGAAAE
jgi:dTDP-4-amino-4,6-dideoxygalactose transaminase